jgi:DNA-binding NarL/FixJ family response regulator
VNETRGLPPANRRRGTTPIPGHHVFGMASHDEHGSTNPVVNDGALKQQVMNSRPRVLVADDHRAMLDTLVRLLSREFDVVAAVMDGLAVVTKAEQLEPDLLVLDIAMPGLNGIAAATRLKEHGSTAKVVFVTNMRDREFVQESLALGEVGFVVKDRLVADLLPAIRRVLAGEAFVSPSVSR